MTIFLNHILHDKKSNLITVICLLFFSLLVFFPIGAIHSSSAVENTSEYLANVAENHTVNGEYAAMMVEPKDVSTEAINNPYTEFLYLYGIFREGRATYIGAVNSDKSHSVKIKELDEDINFSFLNVDSGFGVKEYYKDSQGNMVYKQEFYPLELMFYSNHPGVPGQFSFLYISQSRADSLLDKEGLEHTRDNYKNLLNTLITLEFDGVEYKFAIDNIYYERNYFYQAINEVMGEFLLGGARYPKGIKRQGVFFLRNYPYQNKYYIQYAVERYPLSDFDFKVLDYNFKDNFVIDESKLVYSGNPIRDGLAIGLAFIPLTLLICAILLIYFGKYEFTLKSNLFIAFASAFPYFIFWFIHLFTKSAFLFSSFTLSFEIWCLLGFVFLYLLIFLVKRSKKQKEAL